MPRYKNFSIRIASNYPLIADNSKKPNLYGSIPSTGYYTITNVGILKESFDEKPGFDIATTFQVYHGKNFFIESGLSLQYYRYRRTNSIEINTTYLSPVQIPGVTGSPLGTIYGNIYKVDSLGRIIVGNLGVPVGYGSSADLGRTTVLYLQLPVIIGKSFLKSRLQIKVGLSTNFLLQSTEFKQVYSVQTGISEHKDKHANGFSKFMVNGMIQTTYFIMKNIGLDITYQRSFNSIYTDAPVGKSYYNVFSLGASYHFFKGQNQY